MEPFSLPPIQESGKLWGPSTSQISEQFKDIPYAPYSKSDKLGRFADWNETEQTRTGPASSGAAGTLGSGRPTGGASRGRGGQQQQAYGAGAVNSFTYFHVEDEASFSLVDNKAGVSRRGGPGGASRGRGAGRGAPNTRGGPRNQARGGWNTGRGGAGRTPAGRGRGWRDWDKASRTRESSVPIAADFNLLEEIEFSRLTKLRLEVQPAETLSSYGKLYPYDKSYDRITTKAEKPLQILDRLRYNPTTSDDIVIQQLSAENKATIFATDTILSVLMCAPRSVYSWDIVIIRDGDKLFFDKRDGSSFDFITVNENAADPPLEGEKDNINSPGSLSLEATFVDHNFSFQVVREDPKAALSLPHPNPFYGPDETEPLASCAYRYQLYNLSIEDDEHPVKLAVRTQIDSFIPGAPGVAKGKDQFITLKTLNEFDSRAQGAGGAPDWRTKLDSQRGAVVSTEMKNNSAKLARWAVQSVLAGADAMKIGYVSRANPRETSRHVILSTSTVRPSDFASQLNVSFSNGWGIVRTIADLCLAQPDGKYLLVKDPNKPVIRLYAVPAHSFSADYEEGFEQDAEADEPEGEA